MMMMMIQRKEAISSSGISELAADNRISCFNRIDRISCLDHPLIFITSLFMMLSSKVSILLIGGGGYVGTQLAHDILSSDGYSVGLIDLIPCPAELINKCRYYSGSGTDFDFLDSVMADFNPTIVVLIASWGMSGVDMLDRRCFEINVACASNAVKACIKHNISKLIYTSTYNVVFGGQEIINGSESLAYYPVEGHSDCYSASKYMAEDLVLKGNGSKMRSGGRLTTCALRPAAIYGEGERRHLPRILDAIDSGMFVMRIGNATVDWLHVENLVCVVYII